MQALGESLCGAACGYDGAYHIRALVSNTGIWSNSQQQLSFQTSAVSTGLGLGGGRESLCGGAACGYGAMIRSNIQQSFQTSAVSTELGRGEPGAGTGGRESPCGAAACGFDGAYHIRALVSNTGI